MVKGFILQKNEDVVMSQRGLVYIATTKFAGGFDRWVTIPHRMLHRIPGNIYIYECTNILKLQDWKGLMPDRSYDTSNQRSNPSLILKNLKYLPLVSRLAAFPKNIMGIVRPKIMKLMTEIPIKV